MLHEGVWGSGCINPLITNLIEISSFVSKKKHADRQTDIRGVPILCLICERFKKGRIQI
jgi:hypothetical protein